MVKAFPLNQQEYSYNAQDVSYYYAGRHSGVFALDTNCQVSIVSNMTIKVAKGKGWLAHGVDYGVVFWMEEDVLLTVPVGDVASPRWDYVCVGWETTEVKENPTIYIKSGSPAVTPAEPTLENSANKIEICLAKIYVPSGTTNLRATGVTLTDTRADKAYCGLVGDDLRTTNLEERATNLEERATSLENRTTTLEGRASDSETEINKIKNGTTPVGKALSWKDPISFTIDSITKNIDGSLGVIFNTIDVKSVNPIGESNHIEMPVMNKGEKRLLIYNSYESNLIIPSSVINILLIYSDFSDKTVYSQVLEKEGNPFVIRSIGEGRKKGFVFMVGV